MAGAPGEISAGARTIFFFFFSKQKGKGKVTDSRACTHERMMDIPNAALACIQYPFKAGFTGAPQDLVIYHGGPGCGCLGSVMSEPA